MDRCRKRSDGCDQLPADKRPCSSPEFPPTATSAPPSGPSSSADDSASASASAASYSSCSDSDSDDGDAAGDEPGYTPPSSSGRRGNFQRIVENITAGGDDVAPALLELCEALSFCNEDSVSYFPIEAAVPALVLIAGGEKPEEMLLAVRAITYLCDAMPRSAESVVRHGALAVLCGRLLAIEYLDVAEQCLQALEKISKKQPVPCLQAGMIDAVLTYIDFFSTSVQRTAVSAVANACKRVPTDCAQFVMESVPALCNLLQYEDQKLVETVATCLIRIVDSFNSSAQHLEELCQKGVVPKILHLIGVDGRMSLSQRTCTNMIGILTKLASSSLVAVRSLLELSVGSTLKGILVNSDLSRTMVYPLIDDLHSNQVYEILKLVNQLIPPVARDLEETQSVLDREKILTDEPALLSQFSKDMVPIFIKAVSSGANLYVSYGCVSVLGNIFYFSSPEMLQDLLKETNISSFLAGLLSRKDHHVCFSALKSIEILMQKLPENFLSSFIKEGVVYAIDSLLMQDEPSQTEGEGDTSRCMCYSFNLSKNGNSESKLKTCRVGNGSVSVSTFARELKLKYFTQELVNSEIGLTEISHKLKTCCQLLNGTVDQSPSEDYLCTILGELMRELSGGQTMTTFEFMESGLIKSLANYLCNGRYINEIVLNDLNMCDHLETVVRRFKSFARVSLSKTDQGWEEMLLTLLVRKLQGVLSSFDNFPVILSHGLKPRNSIADVPIRHGTAHPCVRVRFVRDENETDLAEFDGGILNVESSSYLADIEKYLWPKVNNSMEESSSPRERNDTGADEPSTSSSSQIPASQEQHTKSTEENLVFSLKGKDLDRSITLYQSILEDQANSGPDLINGPKFWNDVHKVTYKSALNQLKTHPLLPQNALSSSQFVAKTGDLQWNKIPFFSSLFSSDLPFKLNKSSPLHDTLFMLRILEGLNRLSFQLLYSERIDAFSEGKTINLNDLRPFVSRIPPDEFVNKKLTDKLEQQMRDPLVSGTNSLPQWCNQLTATCPFLLPFDTKRKYFRLSTFGRNQYNSNNSDSNHLRFRDKYLVDRSSLFESAYKMMELHVRNKSPLDVEYSGEVGTGLGPTIEFYTLISQEFQKVGLGLWREVNGTELGFVAAPFGLFPRPWSAGVEIIDGVSFGDVNKRFVLLGQIVAKATKDGRIMDIPLSRAFYKLILDQELSVYDIQSFDLELGRTLLEFRALVNRRKFLQSQIENCNSKTDLLYRDIRIEDLGIDFALPGYTDYVLSSQNCSKLVNSENLEEYVEKVVDATIRTGISRQIEAFKSGFNEVFPLKALQVFSEEELDRMLCGEKDAWNFEELMDNIKFDHGYTASSLPVLNLLEIIQEFECSERRAFLQFVTGSPRLPLGGLAALNPKLTVVRKHSNSDADMELPSVMTCANYLKLPPYSSKERMKQRLLYAIREGQGSFHLS